MAGSSLRLQTGQTCSRSRSCCSCKSAATTVLRGHRCTIQRTLCKASQRSHAHQGQLTVLMAWAAGIAHLVLAPRCPAARDQDRWLFTQCLIYLVDHTFCTGPLSVCFCLPLSGQRWGRPSFHTDSSCLHVRTSGEGAKQQHGGFSSGHFLQPVAGGWHFREQCCSVMV